MFLVARLLVVAVIGVAAGPMILVFGDGGRVAVEDVAAVSLCLLAFAVGGPLSVVAVLGPPLLLARGLVRLGSRVPGGLGRRIRARERADPGTLVAAIACAQVIGLLVALWTGSLGRVLLLASGE